MDMRPAKYSLSLSSKSFLDILPIHSLGAGDLEKNSETYTFETLFARNKAGTKVHGKLCFLLLLWGGMVKSCDGRHESRPKPLQLASFKRPFLDLCSLGRGRLLTGISQGSIDEMSTQPNPVWWQLVCGKFSPKSQLATAFQIT